MDAPAAFYFDLASPTSYLAAERALAVLPGPCPWQPILASRLPAAERYDAYRCETDELAARDAIERRARALGLQPLRWPARFPFDSEPAMLAATYARRIGKCVPFALAAFRQAFAGGNPLEAEDTIAIAGAACEIHPRALLAALAQRGVRAELERATAQALARGVGDVPAVRIGELVLAGEQQLEQAGELLAAARL
ncbi:MAG TPA: DsbA family protein [Solirubrobacteraceae bacterium]|nr:DsbA family protein [Solirubrobacteraceae bacterium]